MSNTAAGSKGKAVSKILLWGILLLPILYVSTCSYISHRGTTAFNAINVGDAEEKVVGVLGEPSVREKVGEPPFSRYSSYACMTPCSERLWYENRLGFVGEAWSVDLNANRKVIDKAQWMSP